MLFWDPEMARLFRVDGTIVEVQPGNRQAFTLDELHRLLDCRIIDVARLADGRLLILDDEARLAGKPPNRNAALHGRGLAPGDAVVGDVLVCADGEVSA
jgi:hypothetical protein